MALRAGEHRRGVHAVAVCASGGTVLRGMLVELALHLGHLDKRLAVDGDDTQVGKSAHGSLMAEDVDVADCVAAKAVAAVDAASDLAGCEQAGNGLAVGVEHLGVGVDAQAAHGVVDAGGHLDRVERGIHDGLAGFLATHGIVFAIGDGVVVGGDGLDKGLGVGVHELAELLDGVGDKGKTLAHELALH